MGQVLHGSATTTHAVRSAIQKSDATIKELSRRYNINPKTVMKWKYRNSVEDQPMGRKNPRSTVLSVAEEAACVAFRKHSLLPLDDCLYALQETVPCDLARPDPTTATALPTQYGGHWPIFAEDTKKHKTSVSTQTRFGIP